MHHIERDKTSTPPINSTLYFGNTLGPGRWVYFNVRFIDNKYLLFPHKTRKRMHNYTNQ